MKLGTVTLIILAFLMVETPVFAAMPVTVDGIPSHISTPEDIARWFREEFRYTWTVSTGSPQTLDKFITSKNGSCLDFAVLASKIMENMGNSGPIVVVKFKGLNMGHAIYAWKRSNGKYSFLSNQELYNTNETRIIDMVERYYPDWESFTLITGDQRSCQRTAKRTFDMASRVTHR